MIRRLLISALFLLTVSCASQMKKIDNNPPFSPHAFRYFDVDVAWQAERSKEGLQLVGSITNRRAYYLRDLELTVRLLDTNGKVIGKSYADFPTLIPPGASEPFRVDVHPSPGSETTKVRFTYYYWLAEPAPAIRGSDDVPHFGGFESVP